MRINFVMSNTVESGIFNAIIGYFKKYLPDSDELFVTQYPLEGMDIYHYHRPNLEKNLLRSSVVTVHHDLEDNDPWFIASNYIERYKEADLVICLNHIQKEILQIKYDISNTVVIPHGVNTDLFIPSEKRLSDEKFVIGIISKRYGRRVKGEAYLHELYKRLDSEKIKFIFVGEDRTIDKNEASAMGFESDVYEYLPYDLFNDLYYQLNILLVPSLFEGGPANIPEALYTKTPVLGRRIAMIRDMIVKGKNGYYLTGDFNTDAELINDLASNKNNLYSNLRESILKYDSKILNWNNIVDLHRNSYQKIILNINKDTFVGEEDE